MNGRKRIWISVCVVTFLAVLVIAVVAAATVGFREKKTLDEPKSENEEVVFVPEESTETMGNKSMTTRATRFIEDKEDLGYKVTYDGEKAEQMLDELETLYGQMPDMETFTK